MSTENNQLENEIKAAKEAIEAVLKEHGVTLLPVVVHQGNRTFSHIDVVKVPAEQATAPVVSQDQA
jgi:glutamate 5-kinase